MSYLDDDQFEQQRQDEALFREFLICGALVGALILTAALVVAVLVW